MEKSKIELIGPMKAMNLRIKLISHYFGLLRNSSSTLSVGIVICDKSYIKLFSRICVGNIGRNGRNNEAPAMRTVLATEDDYYSNYLLSSDLGDQMHESPSRTAFENHH